MSSIDDLTGHFPEAGQTFASGTIRKPSIVRKNGTKIYTFIDKKGKKADGVTHHLIQRPNGKYALKIDDGDHRHDKDDIVIARGRTPLKAGGSTKGKTTFGLIQNGDGKCVFLCFGNDGGMEASDRRSERTTSQLANQNFLAVIQHGRSTPIALNPFMSSSYDIDYKQLPGFNSYSDSVDHFFDQIA